VTLARSGELHVRAENAGPSSAPWCSWTTAIAWDCTRLGKGGYSVPSSSAEYLQISRCTADFVLLVEKGTQ